MFALVRTCRQEHPRSYRQRRSLKAKGAELYGLSYKDETAKASGLEEGGNPSRASASIPPAARRSTSAFMAPRLRSATEPSLKFVDC
jgi:hypothetical protein